MQQCPRCGSGVPDEKIVCQVCSASMDEVSMEVQQRNSEEAEMKEQGRGVPTHGVEAAADTTAFRQVQAPPGQRMALTGEVFDDPDAGPMPQGAGPVPLAAGPPQRPGAPPAPGQPRPAAPPIPAHATGQPQRPAAIPVAGPPGVPTGARPAGAPVGPQSLGRPTSPAPAPIMAGGAASSSSGGGKAVGIVIAIILVLGVLGGGGYWWFVLRSTPEKAVTRMLDAFKSKDWKTMYSTLELPESQKAVVTEALFSQSMQSVSSLITVKDFKVNSASAAGDTGKVNVTVTISSPMLGGDKTQTQDMDVKMVSGAWKIDATKMGAALPGMGGGPGGGNRRKAPAGSGPG